MSRSSPPWRASAYRPQTLAEATLLTCAHYLPVGCSRNLLRQVTAIEVSAGVPRAARRFERKFLDHMRELLASAPVLPADLDARW